MTPTRVLRAAAMAPLTLLMWVVVPVHAQSLAEVARKEANRREAVTRPSTVYTNSSLTPDFTTPQPPAETPTESPATEGQSVEPAVEPAAADAQSLVTPVDQQEPPPPHDKGEAYWRGQSERIRARVDRQKDELAGLRQRLDSLADSPGRERDLVSDAIRRAEANLQSFDEEWRRFEQQARDRNVPDAWIR